MTSAPERSTYTPFDQLNDEELRDAMVMHITMGYILKNPGKKGEAESIAKELVSRLTIEQLRKIHPQTFFANKSMGVIPKNPYVMAKEVLGEK